MHWIFFYRRINYRFHFSGPTDYNPPLRSSRQDIRSSIQFGHGDFQNGQEEPRQKVERQHSQPQNTDNDQPYFPIRRQLSSDTITLNQSHGFSHKGGGDGGFFLNDKDTTDGDGTKTSFADLNKIRSNGDPTGLFARTLRIPGYASSILLLDFNIIFVLRLIHLSIMSAVRLPTVDSLNHFSSLLY